MLTRQRRQLILTRLQADSQIVARQLSAELGTSEDTIRRDLRELAAVGLLTRVHGGALPASPALADFETRSALETRGKQVIAVAAARLVQAGQVVFIDGGTTCLKLTMALPVGLNATVVTHSPTIAVELATPRHPGIDVVLVGGRLYKHSVVATGAAAVDAIANVHTDLYFMGASGVSLQAGLCTGDQEEALVKRAIMARAAKTWVLASREKLNAASPFCIAPFTDATGIVLEKSTPAKDVADLRQAGLQVLLA